MTQDAMTTPSSFPSGYDGYPGIAVSPLPLTIEHGSVIIAYAGDLCLVVAISVPGCRTRETFVLNRFYEDPFRFSTDDLAVQHFVGHITPAFFREEKVLTKTLKAYSEALARLDRTLRAAGVAAPSLKTLAEGRLW